MEKEIKLFFKNNPAPGTERTALVISKTPWVRRVWNHRHSVDQYAYNHIMEPRRKTRQILVGDDRTGRIAIGGGAPIAVQTMCAGYTHDIDACVAEINRYHAAGAELVRVAVPER